MTEKGSVRNLILVLGDQLSLEAPALGDADPDQDRIVMAEVDEEIRRHPNHKQRVALFLSAMRHFRDALEEEGFSVDYNEVDDDGPKSLPEVLKEAIECHHPEKVVMTEPGRSELRSEFERAAKDLDVELDVREDDHFLCSHEAFEAWAEGRKRLTMEYFYRERRKDLDVLMDDDEPEGGSWNYDDQNRESLKEEPTDLEAPTSFEPDKVTRGVLELVAERYEDLPGSLERFDWPVTRDQALDALDDFVKNRLQNFGTYQDAMWLEEPYLYHSRISPALNMKLLNPREVVERVEQAYDDEEAPLNAAEGFIRQVIGWREFIRGVYWLHMPDLLTANELNARRELPEFFWTAETKMTCVADVVSQLLETGYAHHIQRLMVTGLFGLLYGVKPAQMHDWYMAMFVDSVEWATLPNVVGMSQFADGGIVGTKPYVASGAYVKRQSNYCSNCTYDPKESTGDDACPFTVLYWDFLRRHRERFQDNRRMTMQLRNLDRKSDEEVDEIRKRADSVRRRVRAGKA